MSIRSRLAILTAGLMFVSCSSVQPSTSPPSPTSGGSAPITAPPTVEAPTLSPLASSSSWPTAGPLRTTLGSPGHYPLPVVLIDATGLITVIEPGPADARLDTSVAVRADPGDQQAFLVSWLGGACDKDAQLTFSRSGSRYDLKLEVHHIDWVGPCILIGIGRVLLVRTSVVIPVDTIAASGTG